jgi:hypothetical protein
VHRRRGGNEAVTKLLFPFLSWTNRRNKKKEQEEGTRRRNKKKEQEEGTRRGNKKKGAAL